LKVQVPDCQKAATRLSVRATLLIERLNQTMTTPRRPPTARSAARLGAVQALYQLDIGGADVGETLAQFSSRVTGDNFENGETGQADFKHLREVVEGAVREQVLLDPSIDKVLDKDWPLHRLDATVRAIIRCAAFEIYFKDNVPARVAINEYVDVASAFFEDGDEPRFVNGALNTLARQRRPQEFV
jgi:transcription antitermination protein NusB